MKKLMVVLVAFVMVFSGLSILVCTAEGDVAWPKKAVQIVLPYNAGGDTDIYARLIAKYLKQELGQNFVVINMPGGSGVIASKYVMAQKPDGYTILFNHTASLVQEVTGIADFSYSDDFENAGTVVSDTTYTLVCRKDSGWKNLEDMIAYAKDNPEKVSYSQVYGSATHLVSAQMENTMGIRMKKLDVGSAAADRTAAFMGKQVDLLVANYLNIKDYIETGDFVALGVCASERVPGIEIPTLVEQGYEVTNRKLYEAKLPKGTNPAIVQKLTTTLEKIARLPDFREELAKFFSQPFYRDPERTTREDKAEIEEIKVLMTGSAR